MAETPQKKPPRRFAPPLHRRNHPGALRHPSTGGESSGKGVLCPYPEEKELAETQTLSALLSQEA